MKKNKLSLLGFCFWFLNSCGYNNAILFHQNQNSTQVILGTNNFKVVGKVSGTAEVEYILMIGGLDKRRIYENAYSEMVNKANLDSGSRALANVVTEEHVGGVPPFYYKRTLTVSATVIEFKW
ncbi:MAG TPA: DUF6567 family protein [Flavobacteriales bacterium]|nr:DUF6567 family protein [Flavobacteriales bacterium]